MWVPAGGAWSCFLLLVVTVLLSGPWGRATASWTFNTTDLQPPPQQQRQSQQQQQQQQPNMESDGGDMKEVDADSMDVDGDSDFESEMQGDQAQTFFTEDIQVGCRELRAKRYISDGFCTSTKPIKEVVCAGHCLPIMDLPWYAEFVKVWARSKLRDWQCAEDVVKRKSVHLLCQNGQYRTYRIKVVKSCKCKRRRKSDNKTGVKRRGTRKGKKRRRGQKRRKNRQRKTKEDSNTKEEEEVRPPQEEEEGETDTGSSRAGRRDSKGSRAQEAGSSPSGVRDRGSDRGSESSKERVFRDDQEHSSSSSR